LEFELIPKRKVVPYDLKYHLTKFGKKLRSGSAILAFYKFSLVWKLEKYI
jgi:hypothetical protein